MENSASSSGQEQIAEASDYLRVSLDQLLSRTNNLILWRKHCVILLESAFRKRDPNYMIFACRVTARFLFCRGAVKAALQLLNKALDIAPIDDKYNTDLIIADYRRFLAFL